MSRYSELKGKKEPSWYIRPTIQRSRRRWAAGEPRRNAYAYGFERRALRLQADADQNWRLCLT
jgi:hypothetical protein